MAGGYFSRTRPFSQVPKGGNLWIEECNPKEEKDGLESVNGRAGQQLEPDLKK